MGGNKNNRRKPSQQQVVMRPYRKRNQKLYALGFRTYQEYLQSDLWKDIRKRVLERDNGACRYCGKRATAVHHSSYTKAALTGTSLDALFAICHTCHHHIEFNGDGSKARIHEVRERGKTLCRNNGAPHPINRRHGRKCKACGKKTKSAKRDLCHHCHRKQKARLRASASRKPTAVNDGQSDQPRTHGLNKDSGQKGKANQPKTTAKTQRVKSSDGTLQQGIPQ